MISDANRKMAQYAVKDALSAHKAFTKWLRWCAGLNEAKRAAGLYGADQDMTSEDWKLRSSAFEITYIAAYPRPVMPSKTRKYRMYEAAYRAARLAGVEIPGGSINDLDGIFRVLTSVTAVLAVS